VGSRLVTFDSPVMVETTYVLGWKEVGVFLYYLGSKEKHQAELHRQICYFFTKTASFYANFAV
jgi:hypothetical protein